LELIIDQTKIRNSAKFAFCQTSLQVMVNKLTAIEFLEKARENPVVDVRSQKEYKQGHIPGALNLPLFNDDERAIIGTLYKNSGKETSVLKGLELVGPKLTGFIKQLRSLVSGKEILVHCWRGGMRSESMAWLFEVAGYHVSLLDGGYKAYRKFIREAVEGPFNFIILGGNTGSGKTEILKALSDAAEQVLDLEAIARHKGSVYGGLGFTDQPTEEKF
jgi:tRNA 2-selenouridine synthase